jgi:hypothetical protein
MTSNGFIDAFTLAVTGRALDGVEADAPFSSHLAALVNIVGSKAAAARTLGISPTTVYRWMSGRQKPAKGRTGASMVAINRRAATSREREKTARIGMRGMIIHGVIMISSETKHRAIRVGPWIPKSTLGRIFNLWMSGQDEKAEETMMKSIDKHYVGGMTLAAITAVELPA